MRKFIIIFGVPSRFRELGICSKVSVKPNDSVCDDGELGMGRGSVVLGYIYDVRYIHTYIHTVLGYEQIVLLCSPTVLIEVGR